MENCSGSFGRFLKTDAKVVLCSLEWFWLACVLQTLGMFDDCSIFLVRIVLLWSHQLMQLVIGLEIHSKGPNGSNLYIFSAPRNPCTLLEGWKGLSPGDRILIYFRFFCSFQKITKKRICKQGYEWNMDHEQRGIKGEMCVFVIWSFF